MSDPDLLLSRLTTGEVPPWKIESLLAEECRIPPPDNFRKAAEIRRAFLESKTGLSFESLTLPDSPYLVKYVDRTDGLDYWFPPGDENILGRSGGGELHPVEGAYSPLTANYIGGADDYYSYCGTVRVRGDIEKEFIGILQYGTGLGPIGVTRGAHFMEMFGGAEVKVSSVAGACRNIGYIFDNEDARAAAMILIERSLPGIREQMDASLSRWGGRVAFVEMLPVADEGELYLFVDFTAEFEHFRGHGAISKATGLAKKLLDEKLSRSRLPYRFSGITQGYDGDLKPSFRNKRGRYTLASVRIPVAEIERITGKDVDRFLGFVRMDGKGTAMLGWFGHTGMGGEIIAGIYKAAKINPHAPLVSSTQRIFCRRDGEYVIYGVELPNVEAGVSSSSEGVVPPLGRELMRFAGIETSREFAAYLAAFVLAGELNLSIEIVREKLYRAD